MAWVYLIVAGILEMTWVAVLRAGQHTTRHWPTLLALGISALSILLMNQALKQIPIGTSYAVWTGIGALGSTILGIAFFGEPYHLFRVLCIVLIVAGLVGLKMSTPTLNVPPTSTPAVSESEKG